MSGPVYRFDGSLNSTVKFPQSLDGHFFAMEFGRRWIKDIEVLANGNRGTINSFPWSGTQVMDSQFGPDGALYVLTDGNTGKILKLVPKRKSALKNQRRPVVAQAFRPANGRRATLKGCATRHFATRS